jgi:excisionase family DNA binding protein
VVDNSDSLPNVPGWLTTKQVAEMFGVARSTVVRWVWEGKLPGYNFGGMMAVKDDDVSKLREGRTWQEPLR